MDRIAFDARVEDDGIIRVPAEFQREVRRGDSARVTIEAEQVSPDDSEKLTVKRMRENPVPAPGFTPPKRDDIYNRTKWPRSS